MVCKYCKKEKGENFRFKIIDEKKYFRKKCKDCTQEVKRNRKRDLLDYVHDLKKQLKCHECGYDDYRALQFHHLDQKDIGISKAIKDGWSKRRIDEEIEKCICLCGNCHLILHFEDSKSQREEFS